MKYAISLLRVEQPEYKAERYDTYEQAEKVFLKIPEAKRVDFGIAELLSEEEIQAQALRLSEE